MQEKPGILNLKEYVLHSHTFRCGHAVKDIEDYVSEAIKQGFKKYGVSDHVFIPGVHHPKIRGDYSLLNEYIDEFNRCKELYGKQIEMYLGFECEYSPFLEHYYQSLIKDKGFDYLICGQHMGFDENLVDYGYITDDPEKKEKWLLRYKDDIVNAIKSGLFLYIAHPDLFFFKCYKITPIYKKITKDIIEAAIKYDVPLEVNINGLLRDKIPGQYDYPCDYFWKQAAKTEVKIVYGGDFHDPANMSNKKLFDKAFALVNRCKIKFTSIDKVMAEYSHKLEDLIKINHYKN